MRFFFKLTEALHAFMILEFFTPLHVLPKNPEILMHDVAGNKPSRPLRPPIPLYILQIKKSIQKENTKSS